MPTIDEIICEGYRSLAQRTLKTFDIVNPSVKQLPAKNYQIKEIFDAYKRYLKKLAKDGAPERFDDTARRTFATVDAALEKWISDLGKAPTDPNTSLIVAVSALRDYFKFESSEAVFKKMKITQIHVSTTPNSLGEGMAGGLAYGNTDQGRIKHFFVIFDRTRPAGTLIINIHEFYHALQPEEDLVCQQLNAASSILAEFRDLKQDEEEHFRVYRRFLETTHPLHYYRSRYFQALARKEEKDVTAIQPQLDAVCATLDFLVCYKEGDAYLTQTDVVQHAHRLSWPQIVGPYYTLLSFTDAIRSVPLRVKYYVGIGLAEYLRNHPDEKQKLFNSPEFHKELSQKYFPPTE